MRLTTSSKRFWPGSGRGTILFARNPMSGPGFIVWRLTAHNADKKKKCLAVERVPLSVEIDPFEDMDDRALQTKRLLKSCEDIILRLQMKEDDPQNN